MVMNRFSQLLAVLTLLALSTSSVLAQQELQMGPPHIDPNGYDPDVLQPFVEPFTFDPDFQFFAPSGVDRLGGEIEPPIGWFATYDRCYLYVTRPAAEPSYTQGDYTWGNRFDIGYMSEEDHGWLVSFFHLDGPSNYAVLEAERINVFEAQDTLNQAPNAIDLRTGGGGGGGGTTTTVVRPGFPVRDRNDPITLERDYLVKDSINAATVSSFELNKTFRIDPLHYGSIIEPFCGLRYTTVNDYYRRDVYQRIDETTGTVVYSSDNPNLPTPPTVDLANASVEQLISNTAQFRNHMFGGQIGLRWFKQKSRWNLSGEVRAFGLQNFQSFNANTNVERTYYDGGINGDVNAVLYYNNHGNSGHAGEFVFGTEIRTEAAYNVTKYLQLRGGVQFVDFARGIGRGNNIVANDQDFLMVGFTGGFTVNR